MDTGLLYASGVDARNGRVVHCPRALESLESGPTRLVKMHAKRSYEERSSISALSLTRLRSWSTDQAFAAPGMRL